MKKPLLITTFLLLFQFSCNVILPPGQGETPATATVVATQSERITKTVEVTQTPSLIATETPSMPPPTATSTEPPAMEDEPEASFLLDVQTGTPVRMKALNHDCDWMGVAGQVFDQDGVPVSGLVVEAGGVINGQPILGLALTSLDTAYGPGGYELMLLDTPADSAASVWVQVKDADGNPLSPQIFLDTIADCDQNLTLVNFVAQALIPDNLLYFPVVRP